MDTTYNDIIEIFKEDANDSQRKDSEMLKSRAQEYIETILNECVPDNLDCPRLLESQSIWGL